MSNALPKPICLEIKGLHAFYGESHILQGIDLTLKQGQVIAILGRNGAGKSTLIKSIMGLVKKTSGSIRFGEWNLIARPPEQIARLGLAWVPEDRGIFASLTVAENLRLPPIIDPDAPQESELLTLFPILQDRLNSPGTRLSGGEQQILAIARMLRTGARTLMLDEPTEGLAPIMVAQIGSIIAHLKRRGYSLLLVEQNLQWIAPLADYFYVLEQGCVVDEFPSHAFEARVPGLLERLGL
jgi:branched-chain amino acid transport system ATP-binding protein